MGRILRQLSQVNSQQTLDQALRTLAMHKMPYEGKSGLWGCILLGELGLIPLVGHFFLKKISIAQEASIA
jgi:hypothetical protein